MNAGSGADFFDISKVQTRRSMVFLAAGALLGVAIAGYTLFTAKGTHGHTVPAEAVALVNQKPILRSDFMTQAQTIYAVPFEQVTHAQRLKILDDMINEELMVQRGQEMDLSSFDPDVRSALVAGVELEVTADVLAQQPTEPELRSYFAQHQDKYSSEGMMQMRDLVLKPADGAKPEATAALAAQAVAALRQGAKLEQVMTRFGLVDSGSFLDAGKVDTGEIFDFAAKIKLGDALYARATQLQPGEISDPVKAYDGQHIMVMIARRQSVPMDFAAAADRVWSDLKSERQASVTKATLGYLRSKADVLIAPELAQ